MACLRYVDAVRYLEVIGDVVVFASRSTEQVVGAAAFGLVRWRRLGVVGFVEGVALRRGLVLGICCHVEGVSWLWMLLRW